MKWCPRWPLASASSASNSASALTGASEGPPWAPRIRIQEPDPDPVRQMQSPAGKARLRSSRERFASLVDTSPCANALEQLRARGEVAEDLAQPGLLLLGDHL